jgi:predicted DNA-binding transcriptional regulator YafY
VPEPSHPTTRLLAILELLQTHGRLNGQFLAQFLHVDRRTVRRYIALLEEMGIPITAGRGPLGGYELVAGFKIPPLIFSEREVLAISLGLAAVRDLALNGDPLSLATAQAKLERVMPPNVKEHMRAIGTSVVVSQFPRSPSGPASPCLALLSTATHRGQRVRLSYRTPPGNTTQRDLDPYGLAFKNGFWYTVGYCHSRRAICTFRLDRILNVSPRDSFFDRPSDFDIAGFLTRAIATLSRRYSISVLLETTIESARLEVPPFLGILEPHRQGVLLLSQADDLAWYARELARLPWPLRVRQPRLLIQTLNRHARSLLARHRP